MKASIKFLQAFNGDSILVTFSNKKGELKNILIDGGTGPTYVDKRKAGSLKKELESIKEAKQNIDLLIITHIDDDHIGGILKFFEDTKFDKSFVKKVWFNSGRLISKHFNTPIFEERDESIQILRGLETSVLQGEKLEDILNELNIWDLRLIKSGFSDNVDNCKIHVLSPDEDGLSRLNQKWEREKPSLETSGKETDYNIPINELLIKDSFIQDTAIPNGSSISLLLEIEEIKLLLLGDSFPDVVSNAIKENFKVTEENKLKVDLLKISHHASKGNTSNNLLKLISCKNFVVSTNSLKHGLPDKVTLGRIIKNSTSPKIFFNYDIAKKVFPLEEDFNTFNFTTEYLNNKGLAF
ncbi:ComEC/Rec2 family competence protein [Adhaeribacter rhizoryzae]|uniref:MBL fold metallo-hydrolase n=1 Tax=Adhaeribacter rhizoryzae TaxID=2607907 RepID=A0A5M6D3I8_9BACT|nr:MBL fold metallo-hydrolase [Adhaeribacter rhizoryzae]KAA5542067.1 MBL fold metallo-hydrolase [Adhaeribacter rhizoryzae]